MRRNEPVRKIMSEKLISVHTGQKLSEVQTILAEGGFHHLPVVSGDKLVGMITSTDMMRLSFSSAYGQDPRAEAAILDHTQSIEAVMQKELVTLSPNSSIREAAETLSSGTFHSLPVVEDGSKLVGMVTTTDLIKYLLAQY